ncbi:hypothetical protein F975_01639 [Acinetobacter sp. ANC 3789]|uniref:hypothetical protein n=1 Tax=Acinetobacter sp. ANC 3789 TaxID=1217714 RepID=UPI0002CE8162|nr:hypothetical protein [Acinetobacter sp. ANC 3789]ENU80585.1 hypothetical protein F975_01639 [Acinetobacter sp. ANC 3789]
MINYEMIFAELDALHSNGVKFFEDYTPSEFDELNDFLDDNSLILGIKVKPHRESKTGNRSIDAILVKKV